MPSSVGGWQPPITTTSLVLATNSFSWSRRKRAASFIDEITSTQSERGAASQKVRYSRRWLGCSSLVERGMYGVAANEAEVCNLFSSPPSEPMPTGTSCSPSRSSLLACQPRAVCRRLERTCSRRCLSVPAATGVVRACGRTTDTQRLHEPALPQVAEEDVGHLVVEVLARVGDDHHGHALGLVGDEVRN